MGFFLIGIAITLGLILLKGVKSSGTETIEDLPTYPDLPPEQQPVHIPEEELEEAAEFAEVYSSQPYQYYSQETLLEYAAKIKNSFNIQTEADLDNTKAQVEYAKALLIKKVQDLTHPLLLSPEAPGIGSTMQEVDLFRRWVYESTGAALLMVELYANELAIHCADWEFRMKIACNERTQAGVSAREGGYQAWYLEHYVPYEYGGDKGKPS